MAKRSAGILLYRLSPRGLELLLVHPGGPFWARKDLGAWSIPKGEYAPGEDPLAAARRREFEEETGMRVEGDCMPLGEALRQLDLELEWLSTPTFLRCELTHVEPRAAEQLH